MRTKFDIGDFLLSDIGSIRQIEKIHVDKNDIRYDSRGCDEIIVESKLTPEYILEIENYIKIAQQTLDIMKKKLGA